MRDYDGTLCSAPRLPGQLERLSFRVVFRGRCLKVDVASSETTYTLLIGEALEVHHHGAELAVSTDRPVAEKIPRPRG